MRSLPSIARASLPAGGVGDTAYHRHFARLIEIPASADDVFTEIDDHDRLAAHMTESSAMMGGSSMRFTFDAAKGREVGSTIRMTGSVLGMELSLDEVVVERVPPFRKVWQTIGEPNLLVVGAYRMGFTIQPAGASSVLRVFIDFDRPSRHPLLGRMLGDFYARWCVNSMAKSALAAFREQSVAAPRG